MLLFGAWDTWWAKPPKLFYYKVRSYNQRYTKYDRIFLREGKRWGIPPIFLKAIATQETGINIKIKDNGNRNGSIDIGLMRINNIHQNELWYWKRWTLNDMRSDPNKAVYFAAKILKRCIKNYGLNFNDTEKLAKLSYEIIIQTDETSWVKVEEQGGKKLHNDLLKPGAITLQSDKPLHFRIGNEDNVSVKINGKEIDLSKYSRKNIADFNWPIEG